MATVDELYAQVLLLHAKVDDMARKLKAKPPTITNLTATPASLPAGGGSVAVNATVTDATSVKLDGLAVTLPATVTVTQSKTLTLVAHGAKLPDATASVAVAVAVVEPPADDWAAMSANRVFARELVDAGPSDANLAARHPNADVSVWTPDTPTGPDNYTEPVMDELGLRFDVETGKFFTDWVFKLPDFGANSFFALQWEQRWNQAFIDTVFQPLAGQSYPGVKLAIINNFIGSSTLPKHVVTLMDQHKFPFIYQYDPTSGQTRNLQVGINNGADFDLQPKVGIPATCLYTVNNSIPQGQATPGCDTILADTWVRFNFEVQTFDLIPGVNAWHADRKLYMTVNGVRKLVIHYSSLTPNCIGRVNQPWNAVWLGCYMTSWDQSQTFALTPSTWYRRVIVDNKSMVGAVLESPPDPVPVPPPEPSGIPAPGTFAEFTLNKPQDVGMEGGTLGDWCGGTPIPDYGTAGAVAYHGGREHAAQTLCQKQQAVYLIDLATRLYVRKCSPTQVNQQSLLTGTPLTYVGTPNDEWGAFTDGSPGPMHTYVGLCPVPAAWNNGKPGMARVGQSAGASQPLMGESYAATWLFDLTKDTHTLADPAITRLTGNQNYRFDADQTIKSVVSDAPTACIDMARQGWWSFSRTASGSSRPWLSFTAKDGTITNQAAPKLTLARWSAMHKFEDDDILCVLCDEPTFGTMRFGTVKLLALNALPGGTWVTIQPTLPASPTPMNECGYMGPRWSTILQAFVALDTNFNGGATCRVWKLTPPPPGQRLTGAWAWTCETITSADGSTINTSDRGSVNGAWGRLVESVALRSLVWTRDVDKKGVLIRLPGM